MLGVASLMSFAMWAPMLSVPPMGHILKEELLLTHAQTSLLFTAPMLMIAAIAFPAGFAADRIGFRKAAGIGAIIMAIGAVLRGTATNYTSLLAFTFIYGVGLGWVFPNLPKVVSAWIPREKAGIATGTYISAMLAGDALGLAITMPLIFPITNTFQGTFFIWSIVPAVAAILWWILVKEPPRNSINETTITGTVMLRQVARNKNLWLIFILSLLHWFFWDTWIGWTPSLMMLKGATPDLAGLIASITLWVGIPACLFIPRLSYKVGLRKPFLWASFITLAFVAWQAIYITPPTSWPLMAVAGIALSGIEPIILALPVEMLPEEQVGTASGLIISGACAGGVIGPWISGHLFDLTGSLNPALLILAGIAIAATGIAFRLPETGPKGRGKK